MAPSRSVLAGRLNHDGANASLDDLRDLGCPALSADVQCAPDLLIAKTGPARQRDISTDAPTVVFVGRLEARGPADAALGTRGAADEQVIAAVYERFGTDGFLRLNGRFTAVLWDPRTERLVLARDRHGDTPLYFARDGRHTVFATELAGLIRKRALDRGRIDHWVQHGLWPDRGHSAYVDVECVPPGEARVIERGGRTHVRPFWTYTPFNVPRAISIEDARRELDGLMPRFDEPATLLAEPPLAEFLATRYRTSRSTRRPDIDRTMSAIALADHPIRASKAERVSNAIGADQAIVGDWGGREALGGTPSAVASWLVALAGVFERSPTPKNLSLCLEIGLPIDRALERRVLKGALADAAARVGYRWLRHVPPSLSGPVQARLRDPDATPGAFDPVTSDTFVDRRYAETCSRELEAELLALRRATEHPVVAPFMEPLVIEALFSWPPTHFISNARTMQFIGDGESITETASRVARNTPTSWVDAAASFLGRSRPDEASELDRWAGLGAFLLARH